MRYASDVRRGRAVPIKMDQFQRITPKSLDANQILTAAADAVDLQAMIDTLAPSDPYYQGLRQTLARYRAIAEAGGWPPLPDGPKLVPGESDSRVPILRRHLEITGDLSKTSAAPSSKLYDEELRQAVRRFQERHGLQADGVIGASVRELLNVPVDVRIHNILVNLERARWLPDELGDPYVLVNMAAFNLEVVKAGEAVLDSRVVVGRPVRSTPVFSDEISYIEFNPYWHVPRTILIKDKLPILRSNPASLTAQKIRVVAPGGAVVDPTTIDWSSVSSANFPYSLRQDPGERNALGRIKFMFPNPFDVYLHDTPSRSLFRRSQRAFSSGCIRVEKPAELAEFLLRGNEGWTRGRIEQAIASRKNRAVTLATPVPVHLVYFTAWLDREGRVQFRNDLYNRDAQLVATLDGRRE